MVIKTNIQAEVTAQNLLNSQALLSKSLARLSSGSKIIDPSDDAGGLAVASRLDAQIQRTQAAQNNVASAVSFTQTQDGYLAKIGKALNRMSELAVMAQDGIKSDADRALYDKEFRQLSGYINGAASKEFNGLPLFSDNSLAVTTDSEGSQLSMAGIDLGSTTFVQAVGLVDDGTTVTSKAFATPVTAGTFTVNGQTVTVAATDTLGDVFAKIHAADANLTATFDPATGKVTLVSTAAPPATITISDGNPPAGSNFVSAVKLTSGSGSISSSAPIEAAHNIANAASATAALASIKAALDELSDDRATIGAYQTRLNYTAEQLTVSKENLSAASSRIQDVDVAEESTNYARQNILVQSGTAMLAQANQLPQTVLRLLQ